MIDKDKAGTVYCKESAFSVDGWKHTHSASCWVAAETPPWSASLTEQRQTELHRDKHSFHITSHISFLQVNTVNQEENIM